MESLTPSRLRTRFWRRCLLALVLLAALPSLVAAWLIPLGRSSVDLSCAPDETAHMEYVVALADGQFAAWPDNSLRMSMYPPSQYAAQVAGLLAARAGGDAAWQYRDLAQVGSFRGFPLARLGSVVLGIVGVLALVGAALRLTDSPALAGVVGLVAALYPQRFFIDAYVNADALTFTAGALLVLALAEWFREGEAERGLLMVGAAAGVVLLGKPNGYALLPATGLWVAWAALQGRLRWRRAILAAVSAAALAAPVLLWNAQRNGGFDMLGVGAYRDSTMSSLWAEPGLVLPGNPVWIFARALTRSAFMKFGNMNLALPVWLYLGWILALPVGLMVAFRSLLRAPAPAQRAFAWLAVSTAISLSLLLYQSFTIHFAPQGRYMLLPVVLLTLVAVVAPSMAGVRASRLWIRGWIVYLTLVAVWSLGLLAAMPCGPHAG
ncbi:MAG: glycosyltransferase family 39 protein [bacterium]